MLAKWLLVLSGGLLGICWLGTLYDRFMGKWRIAVGTDSLFIGLSFLLAAVLVSFVHLIGARNEGRLAADYSEMCEALGDGEMTRDELETAVGKDWRRRISDSGDVNEVTEMNAEQRRSLDVLVYEGRILKAGDRYRLPGRTG